MLEETSAGAVIFRVKGGRRLYLLLHYPSGHWDFVKGKMESGESPHQTAVREAGEETQIRDLEFADGFEERVYYDFQFEGETIHKTVIFYLARTKTAEVGLSHEHLDYVWLGFGDACRRITHENARRVISRAEALLARLQREGRGHAGGIGGT